MTRPEHVTRRGREAVVVLSGISYRCLKKMARNSASGFVAHLLNIPKGTGDIKDPSSTGKQVINPFDR